MGALDTARQPLGVVSACIVDMPFAAVVRGSCIEVAYQRHGACWLGEPEFARG